MMQLGLGPGLEELPCNKTSLANHYLWRLIGLTDDEHTTSSLGQCFFRGVGGGGKVYADNDFPIIPATARLGLPALKPGR